jgi:acyl-coenzyme A thioesterase PaaI-like protein
MNSQRSAAVQDFYPEDFAHCYGCGSLNAHGLRIKTYVDGEETVAHFVPLAHHTAIPGFVYGGLIASLIDCHSMATAAAAAERAAGRRIGEAPAPRFVTAALHVNYLQPTPLGPELTLRSHVQSFSPRKVVVVTELSAEGKTTATGEVIAVPLPGTMASRRS